MTTPPPIRSDLRDQVSGASPTIEALDCRRLALAKSAYTTVASIVRGLTRTGLRVAAGKVTGTGSGGDPMLFHDSGASRVLDFTDFGYGSTYRLEHEEVRALLVSLIDELAASDPDVVVVEVADGLYQPETARLVGDPLFKAHVDEIVFAAGEALGAMAGQALLAAHGLAPVAISGMLTASPLAKREAATALHVPVLDTDELASAGVAGLLLARIRQHRIVEV